MPPNPPPYNTQEYLWWSQGANDEAKIRDGKLSAGAREVRETLEALAELPRNQDPPLTREDLVYSLARIFCPDKLRRKYR